MNLEELSKLVIGKAIDVHKALGPGLLEKVYRECLFFELQEAGVLVEQEVYLPVRYKQLRVDQGYRVDLLVENQLIIELKAVEVLNDKHRAQLLTYLKLSNNKLGLLINFNEVMLKHGVRRVVNNL